MSSPTLVTYQSEPSVEKTFSVILSEQKHGPPQRLRGRTFNSRCISTSYVGNRDGKILPQHTETASLSVLAVPVWLRRGWHCCQSGSTPTRTLRAHAIGACAAFAARWLAEAAVNPASAREPGSPVAPSVRLSSHLCSAVPDPGQTAAAVCGLFTVYKTTGEATEVHLIYMLYM